MRLLDPARLRKLSTRLGFEQDWYLIAFGAAIGTLTGFGAIAFAAILHETERWVGLAQEQFGLVALVLIPMVGMGLTGALVLRFASDARGHGVPQVIRAIIKEGGVIPARVGIVKALASILTVGSGGSAGTEGPIVQIGATIGSVVGQRMRIDAEKMRTLVGCGAAAGIASIFNAPIAGVIFVMEILLRDFSVRTFVPIVVASVFASVVTLNVLGENEAIFPAGDLHHAQFTAAELPTFALLGLVCGLAAVGFNRLLHAMEDAYAKLNLHPLLKPITGAAALGLLAVGFLPLAREAGATGSPSVTPAFFGNGYSTITMLLSPEAYRFDAAPALPATMTMLGLLVVLKAVATSFTLASGGSGGVFAPSLFLGAATGAAVGVALEHVGLLPDGSSPASYALVGMAALLAGSSHAPLTAIFMLFELTRNTYVVLPIMLAAVLATVVAQLIDRDSIYTHRLRAAGIAVGSVRDMTLLRKIHARSVDREPLPEPVYPSDPVSKLIALHATYAVPDFPVVDEHGRYLGMVTGLDLRTALIDREAIPLLLVAEIMRTDLPTIEPDEMLDTVLDKFSEHDVASLCLRAAHDLAKPAAMITRRKVMQRYREALESA